MIRGRVGVGTGGGGAERPTESVRMSTGKDGRSEHFPALEKEGG